MLSESKNLKGYLLENADGQIGKVKEFYFDDQYWAVRYLVADTGNWLTGRQVLISPYALEEVNSDANFIWVDLTRKQIENSPSLSSDKPVSRQFEKSYFDFYHYPLYWSGSYLWGYSPFLDRNKKNCRQSAKNKRTWDPHLRSTRDVIGHHVEASDGMIGHISDFIIDDSSWAIRYLVVDTRKWWGGCKVLVSPQWVSRVSWPESKVYIDLTREKIRQSPKFQGKMPLKRDYESKLHKHYGREVYWVGEQAAGDSLHGLRRRSPGEEIMNLDSK